MTQARHVISHCIDSGIAAPAQQRPYRLPYTKCETVRKEPQVMEDMGVIIPSSNEWAAPIVLVPKKDGAMRFCVDYRGLIIDKLGRAKYISTLDLTRGYWQVTLEEHSTEKTAFATPFELNEFAIIPFRLHGAAATFQCMMIRYSVEQKSLQLPSLMIWWSSVQIGRNTSSI